MAWTNTSSKAGPLVTDSFVETISGLTPSTSYTFRARMIVDGVEYFGETCTISTSALPLNLPTVHTGDLGTPNKTSIFVYQNGVDDDGGSAVVEYGMLYSQSTSYNSEGTLIYENVGAVVKKDVGSGSESDYEAGATGLTPNTTTYMRAYARTAAGTGYGEIKNAQTAADTVTIAISNWQNVIDTTSCNSWCAKLSTSRELVAGEGFDLIYQIRARSISTGTGGLSHYVCATGNITRCGNLVDSASSCVPSSSETSDTDFAGGSIRICGANSSYCVDNYTLCANTQMHAADYNEPYTNHGLVVFSGIDNCSGGVNYALCTPNEVCANSATAFNPTCNGGVKPIAT